MNAYPIRNITFQSSLEKEVVVQPPILFAAALKTSAVPKLLVFGCSGTGQHRGEGTVKLDILTEKQED